MGNRTTNSFPDIFQILIGKLCEVENLSIEHKHISPTFIPHRLRGTRGGIDDGKTAVSERNLIILILSSTIRTPAEKLSIRCPYLSEPAPPRVRKSQQARNTTHDSDKQLG
jgi:hypothetical protein